MMHKKILEHFENNDDILFRLALQVSDKSIFKLKKSDNFFLSLCREIVGQQLAGSAADAIFNRFVNLFPNKEVDGLKILKIPEQTLRKSGMSWAKVRAIKDLALKTKNKEVALEKLGEMEDKSALLHLLLF